MLIVDLRPLAEERLIFLLQCRLGVLQTNTDQYCEKETKIKWHTEWHTDITLKAKTPR